MMKANAGYRALAVSDPEPTHVVPLARFGGAAAAQPPAPAGEKFSFFRDRAPATANPLKPGLESIGKNATGGDAPADRRAAPTLPKGDAPASFAPPTEDPQPSRADHSPWSRDETLPASVLFDSADHNDILRFLVDRFALERRKGDIFTHVRPIGSAGSDGDAILSFVDPAKSSLGAELIAVLIKARRAAGCDVTVIEPPADHGDAGFWQTFTRAG